MFSYYILKMFPPVPECNFRASGMNLIASISAFTQGIKSLNNNGVQKDRFETKLGQEEAMARTIDILW